MNNRTITITYNDLNANEFDDVIGALIWTTKMNVTISDCDPPDPAEFWNLDPIVATPVPAEPWWAEAKRLEDEAQGAHKVKVRRVIAEAEAIAKAEAKAQAEAEWIEANKAIGDEERDPRSFVGQGVVQSYPCEFCGSKKGFPCVTSGGKNAQFTHGSRIAKSYGVSGV